VVILILLIFFPKITHTLAALFNEGLEVSTEKNNYKQPQKQKKVVVPPETGTQRTLSWKESKCWVRVMLSGGKPRETERKEWRRNIQ